MNKRSQRALDRAIEAAQERRIRNHNAWTKRLEDAERKRRVEAEKAAAKRRVTLRGVK